VLHAHHRKPVARGGAHTLDNLALLCVSCHGHTHEKDFKTGSPWAQARDRRRKSKTQQGSRRGRQSQPSTPNSS
jgi:5-methylcytosine-specific restriction endonuclease McrA